MSWRALIPMKLGGCPAPWRLSRALSEGDDDVVLRHVRGCAACGAEWAALARTSTLARALPVPAMTDESRERIAAQLAGAAATLSTAGRGRARGIAWKRAAGFTLLACGGAAAAGVVFHLLPDDRARPELVASLASIRAVGNASFSRVQPPPDEIVRLDEGTLELDVAPPSGGRRFRIATADAELDAPEGHFSVQASARTLAAVRVFQGYVEVRAQGGGRAALHAGDEWTRSASLAAVQPQAPLVEPVPSEPPTRPERAAVVSRPAHSAAMPRTSPRPHLAPVPSEPPSLPTAAAPPQRASFERGWRLLRSGEPAPAAEAFREVEALSRGDAIAEDASFWRSVALARANQTADARSALAEFIARFPSSSRVGEASAMLGWMLAEAGDAEGARRAFERALHDRVDRVRASAESGLTRLAPNPNAR